MGYLWFPLASMSPTDLPKRPALTFLPLVRIEEVNRSSDVVGERQAVAGIR